MFKVGDKAIVVNHGITGTVVTLELFHPKGTRILTAIGRRKCIRNVWWVSGCPQAKLNFVSHLVAKALNLPASYRGFPERDLRKLSPLTPEEIQENASLFRPSSAPIETLPK